MKDSYKHKGRRKRLVETLRSKGIADERVLDAMMQVPRHFFFPRDFEDEAYEDRAFPIGEGQTISQPYTVAYQSSLLKVMSGDKVLEIGTGSGYQAAVLHAMGCKVFTVERHASLHEKARELFLQLGMDIHCYLGDGSLGWMDFAPYKGIVVTAAAPDVSENLLRQLDVNGRLVIPTGAISEQRMSVYHRAVDNKIKCTLYGRFKFVPLIGEKGWKE